MHLDAPPKGPGAANATDRLTPGLILKSLSTFRLPSTWPDSVWWSDSREDIKQTPLRIYTQVMMGQGQGEGGFEPFFITYFPLSSKWDVVKKYRARWKYGTGRLNRDGLKYRTALGQREHHATCGSDTHTMRVFITSLKLLYLSSVCAFLKSHYSTIIKSFIYFICLGSNQSTAHTEQGLNLQMHITCYNWILRHLID